MTGTVSNSPTMLILLCCSGYNIGLPEGENSHKVKSDIYVFKAFQNCTHYPAYQLLMFFNKINITANKYIFMCVLDFLYEY